MSGMLRDYAVSSLSFLGLPLHLSQLFCLFVCFFTVTLMRTSFRLWPHPILEGRKRHCVSEPLGQLAVRCAKPRAIPQKSWIRISLRRTQACACLTRSPGDPDVRHPQTTPWEALPHSCSRSLLTHMCPDSPEGVSPVFLKCGCIFWSPGGP